MLVPTPNTHQPVDWARTERVLAERVPGWLSKVGMHDVARHIRAQRTFTAETWRDEFNVFRGAVFNLAHSWLQLGPLRPKVKNPDVEGLYWVGGGTHPGSGLLTIMESANIAADYLAKAIGRDGSARMAVRPAGAREPRGGARRRGVTSTCSRSRVRVRPEHRSQRLVSYRLPGIPSDRTVKASMSAASSIFLVGGLPAPSARRGSRSG